MCGVEVIVHVVCFQAVSPCDHLTFELMSAHSYISISVQRLYVKLSRAMSKESFGTRLVCVIFIVPTVPEWPGQSQRFVPCPGGVLVEANSNNVPEFIG